MTKEQFEKINKWQKETFPTATALSKVFHLKDEVQELILDVSREMDSRHEFADCFMLLFGAAASSGMSYEDICNCIDEKMAINRKRKWGTPDENGVSKHLKD